jgi:hypothetical protein
MASEVCNIGPREQRKRRLLGFVALAVGVAWAFIFIVYDVPRPWRVIIFLPIWIASLGFLQARERICIALAARGMRNMDAGEERVEDRRAIEELQRRAQLINRRALLTAALATLLALLFP